jgi:hypothetical protein
LWVCFQRRKVVPQKRAPFRMDLDSNRSLIVAAQPRSSA